MCSVRVASDLMVGWIGVRLCILGGGVEYTEELINFMASWPTSLQQGVPLAYLPDIKYAAPRRQHASGPRSRRKWVQHFATHMLCTAAGKITERLLSLSHTCSSLPLHRFAKQLSNGSDQHPLRFGSPLLKPDEPNTTALQLKEWLHLGVASHRCTQCAALMIFEDSECLGK